MTSSKLKHTIVILIFAVLVLPSFLLPFGHAVMTVNQASTTNLVLGVVSSAPATFFQNEIQDYFIGTPDTSIPYLSYGTVGLDGVFKTNVGQRPVPVPGTDDTQWVMNLASSDLKWSDGVPIDSTDLAYSFGIFLSTGPYANASLVDPYGQVSGAVTNVSILNSTAITVTLANPSPLWPVLSYLYAVYPYHYFKQFTGENALMKTSIVSGPGDSPYVPQNFVASTRTMTLTPNTYSWYWNGNTPTIETITIQIFADETALVNALASGTVDAAIISPSDVQALSGASALTVKSLPSLNQMFIYLRTKGYPWNSDAFRQAMFYIVNKAKIASALYNNTVSVGNPLAMVPQAMSTYWPGSSTPTYDFSTNQAVTHLQLAGLTKNSAGNWVTSNGAVVTISLETTNSDPNFVRAAQFIKSDMESIGLKVDLKVVDFATAENDFGSVNFQFLLYPNFYSSIPFRYLRNPANYPNYVNSTFRAMMSTALHDLDPVRSLQELKQAELYFANAAVFNSVVVLPQFVAYNSQLFTNWEPTLDGVPDHNAFHNAVFDETLLTAVSPMSAASSTTATTSTTAPSGTDYTTVVVAVVVIAIIVGAAVAYQRRKKKPQG